VLDLIQQGRAQLGLMAARAVYPADIGAATVAEESEIGLFVGRMHALAAYGDAEVPHAALRDARELRLNTYVKPEDQRAEDRIVVGTQRWLAPSYLMLLEMAVLGFGWAELPRWMVEHFARDRLWNCVRAAGRAGSASMRCGRATGRSARPAHGCSMRCWPRSGAPLCRRRRQRRAAPSGTNPSAGPAQKPRANTATPIVTTPSTRLTTTSSRTAFTARAPSGQFCACTARRIRGNSAKRM
jgi:hypothetical protein